MAEPVTTATAAAVASKAKALLGKLLGTKLGRIIGGEVLLRLLNRGLGSVVLVVVLLPVAILLTLLFLVLLFILVITQSVAGAGSPSGVGKGCPDPRGLEAATEIPAVHVPAYCGAAKEYRVNLYLLASIHEVESNFGRSTLPGVRSGSNICGAAGPMQFGVVGVAPYDGTVTNCGNSSGAGGTWASHRTAFRPIAALRPAKPHPDDPLDRRELPSCRPVGGNVGCVYDSLDAIAGAAHKLEADGADDALYSDATRSAVLAYNDSDAYADAVLNQAREWELVGASLTPSAPDGSTEGGARGIVERAARLARPYGTYVCSGHRPLDTDSDHYSNDARQAARDICVVGVDAHSGPPPPELDRAAVDIGKMFGRRYRPGKPVAGDGADTFGWKGYRIQVIWRTPLYGGHMGHIHVGACRGC